MPLMSTFIKHQVHEIGGVEVIEDVLNFAYQFSIENKLTNSLKASCVMDLKEYLLYACLNPYFDSKDDSIIKFKKNNDCYEFLDSLSNKLIKIKSPYANMFIELIQLNRAIMNFNKHERQIMRIA